MSKLREALDHFGENERETLRAHGVRYGELLLHLPAADASTVPSRTRGILALNGASGAGQSFVMGKVERLLKASQRKLPRIFLLATREPRPGEGHKDPYIFARRMDGGFQDVVHPEVTYADSDIYYAYESRPGAGNAILLSDARAALTQLMYLETVIPTLLQMRSMTFAGIPAWGDDLRIVYLAAPSGEEWLSRLLNREPDKLDDARFRETLLGRTASSLSDMELAAEEGVQCVLNHYGKADQAAREILAAWGI